MGGAVIQRQLFNRMREAQANPRAYDEAARKRLRLLSLELTGLTAP